MHIGQNSTAPAAVNKSAPTGQPDTVLAIVCVKQHVGLVVGKQVAHEETVQAIGIAYNLQTLVISYLFVWPVHPGCKI